MNQKLKLLPLALLFGCTETQTPTDEIMHVKVGEEITVNIRANRTLEYGEWRLVSSPVRMDLVDESYTSDDSNAKGSGGMQRFVFRGRKKGTDTLRFYRGPEEEDEEAASSRSYNVYVVEVQ